MSALEVSDIFYSVEGETSFSGKPMVFVRLARCNLACRWCDTLYAREHGRRMSLRNIIKTVKSFNCRLVCVTGGEPMLQARTALLLEKLSDEGCTVLLETNGTIRLNDLDGRVRVIMDVKTPSSGECRKIELSNIKALRKKDEIKFPIASRTDFEWSIDIINRYNPRAGEVLFSPVRGRVSFKRLAGWVKDSLPDGRVQANLHKVYSIK